MPRPPETISSEMPGHLIRRLHQVSTKVFTARMKAAGYDLTPIQFAAIDAVHLHPDLDQVGLAKTIGKDKATIGAVVDRLVSKGLINRVQNRQDKRARLLRTSEKGAALLAAVHPIVAALQKEILPGLTASEFERFVTLAAKATQAAEAQNDG